MTFEPNSVIDIIIQILASLLLFSILVTTLTEMAASFFNLRAIRLRASIYTMLGNSLGQKFFEHDLIQKQKEFRFNVFLPFHLTKETFSFIILDLFDGDDGDLDKIRAKINRGREGENETILLTFLARCSFDHFR